MFFKEGTFKVKAINIWKISLKVAAGLGGFCVCMHSWKYLLMEDSKEAISVVEEIEP